MQQLRNVLERFRHDRYIDFLSGTKMGCVEREKSQGTRECREVALSDEAELGTSFWTVRML